MEILFILSLLFILNVISNNLLLAMFLGCLSAVLLPFIIIILDFYAFIFESSFFYLPNYLQNTLHEYIYMLLLLFFYLIYINTCPMYNY